MIEDGQVQDGVIEVEAVVGKEMDIVRGSQIMRAGSRALLYPIRSRYPMFALVGLVNPGKIGDRECQGDRNDNDQIIDESIKCFLRSLPNP